MGHQRDLFMAYSECLLSFRWRMCEVPLIFPLFFRVADMPTSYGKSLPIPSEVGMLLLVTFCSKCCDIKFPISMFISMFSWVSLALWIRNLTDSPPLVGPLHSTSLFHWFSRTPTTLDNYARQTTTTTNIKPSKDAAHSNYSTVMPVSICWTVDTGNTRRAQYFVQVNTGGTIEN